MYLVRNLILAPQLEKTHETPPSFGLWFCGLDPVVAQNLSFLISERISQAGRQYKFICLPRNGEDFSHSQGSAAMHGASSGSGEFLR